MRLGSWAAGPARRWLTDIAVTLVILVSSGATGASSPQQPTALARSEAGPIGGPALSLSLDPATWWMAAGNTTQIWATWSGAPAGCTGQPLWFRWGISRGFAEGTLLGSDGPTANFTAITEQTGHALVEAQSALLLDCDRSLQTVVRTATSNLTVVAPLTIENITVSPDPAAPGALTHLSAYLVNGEPPYRLRVAWGDGNLSSYNLSGSGLVSLVHRFPAGSYEPTILVTDGAGRVVNGSVAEPISVSRGLAVAIQTATPIAEEGIPVAFSGVVLNAPPAYEYTTSCEGPTPAAGTPATALSTYSRSFHCRFTVPGVAEVGFHVHADGNDAPAVSAQLLEPVAASLALNLSPSPPAGEVGLPSEVTAWISGGVAPFNVTWSVPGNSTERASSYDTDGPVQLPVWPTEAGSYAVTVQVTDAVGAQVARASSTLQVNPALEVNATVSQALSTAGASVAVTGAVTAGSPPFEWWVVPADDPSNESASNGSLASPASFGWAGVFPLEGGTNVSVFVVDQSGGEWATERPVALVPELAASAQASDSSSALEHSFDLNVAIMGGDAPFELNLTSSDNEAWNWTVATDGSFYWTFRTNDSGPVELRLVVRDALGLEWSGNSSVALPASNATPGPTAPIPRGSVPSPNPSTPSDESDQIAWAAVLGVAILLGLAGGLVLLWRRRDRSSRTPARPPDPVAVIRRIVEPAEGAERSTVELLAEEAGVPPELARATVDQLISTGALRAESGPDGEEVLAWSDPG